jgi:hypothetical protein
VSWPHLARRAAVALSSGAEREDDSVTAQLIRDINEVFLAEDDAPLKTGDLLEALYRIEESPWGDWYGKPLTAHGLSRLLRPHRIKTMPVWADGKTVRGYKVDQFSDAFAQLGVRSVSSVRSEARSQAAPNGPNAPNASTREAGENGRPPIGDDGFLEFMFDALGRGVITEGEWHAADRAHRLVASRETTA